MIAYQDALEAVRRDGFLFLSQTPWGFRSISGMTEQAQWFTGLEDTDPWIWRGRLSSSGEVAYGHFIERRLCLIGREALPYFLAAAHVWEEPAYRYEIGEMDLETLRCWERLEQGPAIRMDLRKAMRLSAREGGRVDRALVLLQSSFDAGIVGETQKKNRQGQPYGWQVNLFGALPQAFPEAFALAARLDRGEAFDVLSRLAARQTPDYAACPFFSRR